MGRRIRDLGRHPGPLAVNLGILLLCGIWGSTWLVIRAGLEDLPPFSSLAVRFLLAALVLAAVAPTLARLEGGGRPSAGLTAVHGLLSMAVPYAIVYWVEVRLPSGLTSVLWSIFPMLTAVAAHGMLPEERLAARQWLGLVGGFAGVALMLATDVAAIGPEAVPAALVLLVSPAVAAIGTNWIKKSGGATSSALLNRNGMLVATVAVVALALAVERDATLRWTQTAILSVAYLALVGTVVTFGLYFWLLRHAPATRMALIAYGIPVVALILGGTLGGEAVGLHTVAGMLLILLGVGLVVVGRVKRTPRAANESG